MLFLMVSVMLHGRDKVIFIPGWYTEWINYSKHHAMLNEMFPDAEIEIYKWDSNRLWNNAKISAKDAVQTLCSYLEACTDRSRVTLVGHSLGGRIVIESAVELAAKNLRIKQAILLGTAGDIDREKLAALQTCSQNAVINICCFNENMLKLYIRMENRLPLGFSGLPRPVRHFRQFRMVADELKVGNISLGAGKTLKPVRETIAHLALHYLKTLKTALNNNSAQYYVNYPALELIAANGSVKSDALPGFKEVEVFDGWILEKRKWKEVCRITAPSGRKFYYPDEKTARDNFSKIVAILKTAAIPNRTR